MLRLSPRECQELSMISSMVVVAFAALRFARDTNSPLGIFSGVLVKPNPERGSAIKSERDQFGRVHLALFPRAAPSWSNRGRNR